MVRGFVFVEKFKLFFSRICVPPENMKIHPGRPPTEIQEPWDHAQMIERKLLCRIALTKALYVQIRP